MFFFKKLKNISQGGYISVCTFFGLSIFLMFLNLQISPIYVWGMYTTKIHEKPNQPYIVYKLEYNNKVFDLPVWKDFKRMFYTYTIPKFDILQENNGVDSFYTKLISYNVPKTIAERIVNNTNSANEYPGWLQRYISEITREKINTLTVTKYWVSFQSNESITIDSSKVIIHNN